MHKCQCNERCPSASAITNCITINETSYTRSDSTAIIEKKYNKNSPSSSDHIIIPSKLCTTCMSFSRVRIPSFETVKMYSWPKQMKWNTHSSVFSLQCWCCNKSEMCFTPESPSLLPLRCSSVRCVGFDVRAEVRAAQPSGVILTSLSL